MLEFGSCKGSPKLELGASVSTPLFVGYYLQQVDSIIASGLQVFNMLFER